MREALIDRKIWLQVSIRLHLEMIAERFPEMKKFPIDEKRLLLDELCEDIGSTETPDPNIVKILEERWKAYEDDPSGAFTLEEFRKRIGFN